MVKWFDLSNRMIIQKTQENEVGWGYDYIDELKCNRYSWFWWWLQICESDSYTNADGELKSSKQPLGKWSLLMGWKTTLYINLSKLFSPTDNDTITNAEDEATWCEDSEKWKPIMNTEIKSVNKNNT